MTYFEIQANFTSMLIKLDGDRSVESVAEQFSISPNDVERLTEYEYQVRVSQRAVQHDLRQVDAASVRALRAIALGRGTDEDLAKLAALENEAQALRAEFAAFRA